MKSAFELGSGASLESYPLRAEGTFKSGRTATLALFATSLTGLTHFACELIRSRAY